MSRLMTVPVSRAEATQRAGRAGRVAPGVAYKMWAQAAEGALPAFPPAEIAAADLTSLVLELAQWGSAPEALAFLTQPPAQAMAEAKALLRGLGALDQADRLTDHGRALARLPLHPRLGHMLQCAGKDAALLAAVLSQRDHLQTREVDLSLRLRAPLPREIASEAKRFAKRAPVAQRLSLGAQAALAYPDRIGLRRPGDDPRYILSGGKGAVLESSDGLAGQRLIVACDLDGDAREARVRLAAPLQEAELRDLYAPEIGWHGLCAWSKREGRVNARQQERFGALVLQDRVWTDADPADITKAMLDGVRQIGLVFSPAAARFRARVALVDGMPDMSNAALMARLEDWLLPYLDGVRDSAGWRRFDLLEALRAQLDWDQMQRLDARAPAHFTTPLGRKIPIDYSAEAPEVHLKLQEMFGQTSHPNIGTTPLRVTLLSPAGKPVQTTQDIPGFWATSYADVRRDMRGRYPRHPWPEDPTQADPTLRAKPRGT